MKKLLVLVLGGVLVAGAAYYYTGAQKARAVAERRARASQAGRGAGPQGPNPAEMSFAELCEWLTREYVGYGTWGTVALDNAVAELEEARAGGDPLAIAGALQGLAEILLIHGRNAEAVERLEQAMSALAEAGAGQERLDDLTMALGIAHMRLGEADHCIAMHNPESCLFPLSRGGVWADPSGAVAAAAYFEQYLGSRPESPSARWLLNLAHMAAGTWPEGVPAEWRLPQRVVTAAGTVGRFREVAGSLGLATFDGAGGAILDDFDGDGLLDLVTSSIFPCEPLRYYRNDGAGGFEERTEEAGLSGQLGGLNCLQADYDGDGWLDVLVLRGAWMGAQYGRQRNSLLRNDGQGHFEDVTVAAGLDSAFPTQAGAWADYDLDGDLDLYIGNELFPNELYRNEGDGTFTEVAGPAGVSGGRAFTKGVAFGDSDNDGDPDLYVSNWNLNFFYRNEGDGTFTEIGKELGVDSHGLSGDAIADAAIVMGDGSNPDDEATFATWFFDYDNDGWLDLYVSGYSANLENIAGDYMGEELRDPRRLRIYHNDGHGGFENRAAALGADDIRLPMGANFGDVDNDGWLDFYLGTGQPRFEYLLPNVLYHNVGGQAFVDATIAAGLGHLQKGHGVAFGDLDNDGDQDLFAQMGGFYPSDAFRDALFLNPGNGNHWVTLVLRGARANTRAVGARVEVAVETPAGPRSMYLVAGSGGSFGASSLQQEVGLADATSIARVVIDWPAGQRQVFTGLPLDRFVELVEGRDGFRLLERSVLRFAE